MFLKILCATGILISLSLQIHTTQAAIQLQSYNHPDYYIRSADKVRGGIVTIDHQAKPETWEIVSPGLCKVQDSVGFRLASQNPNVYLRYRNGLVYAETYDHSSSFADSACFYTRSDKWFPGHAAFESVKLQGHFLRHHGSQLKLHPYSSTTLYEMDASFRALQAECQQLQSYNFPNHYFGLRGRDAYILKTAELWIPVRPGLAGHSGSVSFRSCNDAKKYLRHQGLRMYSDNFEKSNLFKLDATFSERNRFYPGTTAYESVNYPNYFIRHAGWRLYLNSYSAAPLYKKDASYIKKMCLNQSTT